MQFSPLPTTISPLPPTTKLIVILVPSNPYTPNTSPNNNASSFKHPRLCPRSHRMDNQNIPLLWLSAYTQGRKHALVPGLSFLKLVWGTSGSYARLDCLFQALETCFVPSFYNEPKGPSSSTQMIKASNI